MARSLERDFRCYGRDMDLLIVVGILVVMAAVTVLPIFFFRKIKGSRHSGLRGAFDVATMVYQPAAYEAHLKDERRAEAGQEQSGSGQPER